MNVCVVRVLIAPTTIDEYAIVDSASCRHSRYFPSSILFSISSRVDNWLAQIMDEYVNLYLATKGSLRQHKLLLHGMIAIWCYYSYWILFFFLLLFYIRLRMCTKINCPNVILCAAMRLGNAPCVRRHEQYLNSNKIN